MKSKNLEILKQNKINIPDFIVLRFEDMISNTNQIYDLIDEFYQKNSDDIEIYSKSLKALIRKNFIYPNLENINFDKYAIRSSANLEDGDKYSFAGMFETYLDIDKSEIIDKIILCLQSMYSKRAIKYMVMQGIYIKSLKMDIIIQKMVYPNYSGILFSSNPQGILNEIVITVGKGLGELVVTDKIDTTSYYYNKTDKIYYYDGKEDMLRFEKLKELVLISDKIKDILNLKYIDIEFCIKNNEIFILQARSMTGINDSNIIILDNSNIVESYPNISLPLTQDFARTVYTGVFRGVAKRILKNDTLAKNYDDVYENMVLGMNGTMYYQINNWYKILQFLPMSHKIIPIWQEMLGVNNKDYNLENINLSFFSKMKTYFSFIYEMINAPKNMENLNEEFKKVYSNFNEYYDESLSNEKLRKLYFEIKNQLISIWDITLINDMYAFIFTGILKKRLKKKYPKDYKEKSANLISGIQNIESMKPVKALLDLAYLSVYEKDESKYKNAYDNYIRDYGDRSLEELKLESETFRTNPKLLDEKINDYASDINKLKEIIKSLNKNEDIEEKKSFYSKKAIIGIKNREISRLNRTRIFGMVRSIFLAIGKNFEKLDLIENYKDIFYLKTDEIFKAIDDEKSLKVIVNKRKAEYIIYEKLPIYNRLIITNTNINKNHKFINKNKIDKNLSILQGISSSNGIVMGEVVVVKNPNQDIQTKDKIIVAKTTDPGWVFMLANSKGIIAEKGSLLSHTAIISRELKIPAIVGVDNAIDILKTGDTVSMNANTGFIEILKENL